MLRAKRLKKIPQYLFAEIDKMKSAMKARGIDIVDLSIGDPDLPTPKHLLTELKKATGDPKTFGYPPYEGIYEFRKSVSIWYKERFNVDLDPNTEVLSLIGSKEGIAHVFLAFVDNGDYTLIPDPGYPVYNIGTLLADGIPYKMPLVERNNFLPDFSAIDKKILSKAKLMFINYPNNPTSAVAPKEFLQEAVSLASKYGFLICSDFAYSEIAFDGYKPMSILEIPGAKDVAIEFHSLSKTYNVTGWRIGMAVGSSAAIKELATIKTNIDSGIYKALQYAGAVALTGSQKHLIRLNSIYEERRNILINGLNSLGCDIKKTKATFYVWARVPKGYTSSSFTQAALEKANVMVVPGSGYGKYGEGYFRISITTPKERIEKAIERFKGNNITWN